MEERFALLAPDKAFNDDIARAQGTMDRGEACLRFDDQTAPALSIKMQRDVIGDRMATAHVDVEAGCLIGEDQIQMGVFEALGVGHWHGRLLDAGEPRAWAAVLAKKRPRKLSAKVSRKRGGL